MKDAVQTLKILVADFARSPVKSLTGIGQRLLYKLKEPAQVMQLRKLTREAPFILQIETINACNAACVFCAYLGMTRKKGAMDIPLFGKI